MVLRKFYVSEPDGKGIPSGGDDWVKFKTYIYHHNIVKHWWNSSKGLDKVYLYKLKCQKFDFNMEILSLSPWPQRSHPSLGMV